MHVVLAPPSPAEVCLRHSTTAVSGKCGVLFDFGVRFCFKIMSHAKNKSVKSYDRVFIF